MNRYDVVNGISTVVFTDFGLESSVLVSPPIYGDLLLDKIVSSDNKVTDTHLCNDIMLLFNQERLSKLGNENVKKLLDLLSPRSSSLTELRSKISDSDLLKVCI